MIPFSDVPLLSAGWEKSCDGVVRHNWDLPYLVKRRSFSISITVMAAATLLRQWWWEYSTVGTFVECFCGLLWSVLWCAICCANCHISNLHEVPWFSPVDINLVLRTPWIENFSLIQSEDSPVTAQHWVLPVPAGYEFGTLTLHFRAHLLSSLLSRAKAVCIATVLYRLRQTLVAEQIQLEYWVRCRDKTKQQWSWLTRPPVGDGAESNDQEHPEHGGDEHEKRWEGIEN